MKDVGGWVGGEQTIDVCGGGLRVWWWGVCVDLSLLLLDVVVVGQNLRRPPRLENSRERSPEFLAANCLLHNKKRLQQQKQQ